MDYNLASLRQRVLIDRLDDEEYDPNIVDRFINDTQRDIFNQYELPFMEKIFQGTIPAGSTMFKMPADVAQIQAQSVTGIPSFADRQVDWREFFERHNDPLNAPASQILDWTLYAGNMLTSAPTDREYTMTLFYIKKPTTLKLPADVPEIPEEFGELLVLGAHIRVLKRNEDYDLARFVQQDYDRMLEQLVNRYGTRIANGPIKMKNQQRTLRRR